MLILSVAKPILEYVKTIRTDTDLPDSVRAFRRLLSYHRPYAHIFILVIILAFFRSYAFSLEPLFTAQIIDQVITQGYYDRLLGLVLNIVYAVAVFGVLNYIITYIQAYASQAILKDIRADYYKSLQSESFGFYDSATVGDLVARATMNLQPVDFFIRGWVGFLTNAIFTGVIVVWIMSSINLTMSLISLIFVFATFYFSTYLWVTTMPLFRKMMLILSKLGAYMQQNILGMKTVRIFRREGEIEEGFIKVEDIYVDTAINAGKIQSKYMPSAQTILALGIILIYYYGTNLIISPSSILTIGDLTLFARYMLRLSFPLRDLSMVAGMWVNASAGLETVYEIMDMPVDVKDRPNAKDVNITKGEIEFKDVTSEYAKGRPVLKNVSFKANPGEKIAVLGATGSGKTSMVYLIPRFYDVDSGSIKIDGVDVRKFTLHSLRSQIGVVMQDVFVFTGTIGENIAFGKPDAAESDIIAAAKLARIHDFIESLPEGYDTIVGERGVTLSGGQRQRLTIARALITNPKVLILDDSLSFVDAKTEQEIQEAIEEAMKGRTCFIIAQRLSTIKNADRILVLDNGEIAEFGTHSALMSKRGIYSRIYETQFLEKEPEIVLGAGVK